ncbi:hypothetical protein [Oceanicaulis alexandrii]|uniref:hypothetical protein n=1 Tax=Oceanicaulis alexandrii TaxID=153233 RepID=UPI0003B476B9|nr:hypothetical protein [Oceanicaulis alexandrii]
MTELAAANPTERAQALIQLTGRLTELLDQETELFDAHMPHKAVEFQAEKTKLATLYRTETKLASKDRSRLSGVDPELKAKLKISTRAFEDALARNGAAVEALKVLTEGLVKAIADEAARQQQTQVGYGPGVKSGSVSALAYNQTV